MTEQDDVLVPPGEPAPAEERPPAEAPAPRPEPAVLPDRSPDDTDEGWGERRGGEERDDDWYERERPPHW